MIDLLQVSGNDKCENRWKKLFIFFWFSIKILLSFSQKFYFCFVIYVFDFFMFFIIFMFLSDKKKIFRISWKHFCVFSYQFFESILGKIIDVKGSVCFPNPKIIEDCVNKNWENSLVDGILNKIKTTKKSKMFL